MELFIDNMKWPFAACLVLTGIHVYLGIHVVARKVIFVDLALAQIAALGTAVGIVIGGYDVHQNPWTLFGYSFAFACMGALLLTITRTRTDRVPHEAVIGIIYAVAFAAGLLLLSRSATGPMELRHIVEGELLFVKPDKVKLTAGLYAFVGLIHWIFRRPFLALSFRPAEVPESKATLWDFLFYLTFGFVITSSVAIAGVFLVFSYLVIPSVAAMLLAERIRTRLAIGWIGGTLISATGCWLSWESGLPTSALIVVLFGAALAIVGVVRRIVTSTDRPRTLKRMAAVTGLLAAFAAAMLVMSKPLEDPYERAKRGIRGSESAQRITAISTFAKYPDRRDEWLPWVREAAGDPHRDVRAAAFGLLGIDAMVEKLGSDDAGVRTQAVDQLHKLGDPAGAGPLLEAAAREPEADIRIEMAEVALELGDARAIGALLDVIEDESVPAYLKEHPSHALGAHVDRRVDLKEMRAWYEANRERLRYVDGRFVAD